MNKILYSESNFWIFSLIEQHNWLILKCKSISNNSNSKLGSNCATLILSFVQFSFMFGKSGKKGFLNSSRTKLRVSTKSNQRKIKKIYIKSWYCQFRVQPAFRNSSLGESNAKKRPNPPWSAILSYLASLKRNFFVDFIEIICFSTLT